jgi:hypothetical protein
MRADAPALLSPATCTTPKYGTGISPLKETRAIVEKSGAFGMVTFTASPGNIGSSVTLIVGEGTADKLLPERACEEDAMPGNCAKAHLWQIIAAITSKTRITVPAGGQLRDKLNGYLKITA